MQSKRNSTMLCDYYELTMANGYAKCGLATKSSILICFSVEFLITAAVPAAGLEQVIDYIENLRFTEDDIEFSS